MVQKNVLDKNKHDWVIKKAWRDYTWKLNSSTNRICTESSTDRMLSVHVFFPKIWHTQLLHTFHYIHLTFHKVLSLHLRSLGLLLSNREPPASDCILNYYVSNHGIIFCLKCKIIISITPLCRRNRYSMVTMLTYDNMLRMRIWNKTAIFEIKKKDSFQAFSTG